MKLGKTKEVKVYDQQLKLAFEGNTSNNGEVRDSSLLRILHKSEFLFSVNKTSYFRLIS